MSDNFKIAICIDCGENFKIDKKDTRTCRCEECQEIKKKNDILRRVKKFREKSV